MAENAFEIGSLISNVVEKKADPITKLSNVKKVPRIEIKIENLFNPTMPINKFRIAVTPNTIIGKITSYSL
jgi:hypothetical protein